MSRIWMPGGGGSGVDLDVVTAADGDILKGKVIVGPDGEPLTGVLELTGTAADSQVLAGKTYYNTDAKAKRTGAMINRGAVSPGGLNAGDSYTIPEGYHNGAGKVTANSLASQTDANTAAGDILKGKTAWVKGSKVTGTMPNHTGTPQHIDAKRLQNNRFEVAVAAGYHGYSWAGNSYEYMEFSEVAAILGLTAAKLAKGQTVCGVDGTYTSDANAVTGNILSGKTAYVNGSKITGTMAVQSILSFSAAPYGAKQVSFTWKNPAKGPFSGVIIVYKTGSYPTSITDGTRLYKGPGANTAASGVGTTICTMPAENTTYYFRVFSYAVKDNAEWIHSTSYTASATTARFVYTFTSSGTFTVPEGVSKIDIFCVGGGGGGGGASSPSTTYSSGGGGGGGYTASKLNHAVSAGTKFVITVGAGGAGLASGNTSRAGRGGTSSFGGIISAEGGYGGYGGGGNGGNGGSGGGGGVYVSSTKYNKSGCNGGADGSAGVKGNGNGGTGQTTTTRAFGESSGTLYAGGGGSGTAGGLAYPDSYIRGAGGAGGGGNGGYSEESPATAGTANTGGGGGSGGRAQAQVISGNGKAGGSGIVIIRIK